MAINPAPLDNEGVDLSTILEVSELLVVVLDPSGRIQGFNRACRELTGYEFQEVMGRPVWEFLLVPEDIDGVKKVFKNLVAGWFPNEHDNWWVANDGRRIWIHWRNTVLLDETGCVNWVVGTGIDMSERRLAEEEAQRRRNELAHVLRQHSINTLASGLAHEITQPLTAITTYARGAERLLNDGVLDEAVGVMTKIARQGERAIEIIQHLRRYVDSHPLEKHTCSLNTCAYAVLELLEHEIRSSRANVRMQLDETVPLVAMDQIQIEQVLVNLVKNALDAISDNATSNPELVIETRHLDGDLPSVELEVHDNGGGFGSVKPDQLFSSFYSSKPRGLGQGLAICRTIIDAHNGCIWARSNPAPGATFGFRLPAEN